MERRPQQPRTVISLMGLKELRTLAGWNVGQFAQGETRSHSPTVQLSQLFESHQRNDGARLLVSPLHVRMQIRPACHIHSLGPGVGLHRHRLLERPRLQVLEGREPEHQRRRPAVTSTAFSRPLPPSTALPSPPSHGGATRMGSGHGRSGNPSGPNRGSSPFSLRRSALKTFSGVIGTSSMRTPTASYTAFATAGGTGRRGPWPHSFAPNGPFGSGSSPTWVTTSHISRVMGLF